MFDIVSFVFLLILYILISIGLWKAFTKADVAGWKAIIPIYNDYVLMKLTWCLKYFKIKLVFFIIAILVWLGQTTRLFSYLGIDITSSVYFTIFNLSIITILAILEIMTLYRFSKSYGHGGGYTVGLVFLSPIYFLIIGFGRSEYKGNLYQIANS